MIMDQLSQLASFQRPDGAFPSYVELRKGEFTPDINCFTTACIVRMLRHTPLDGSTSRVVDHSLDWLQQQQSRKPPHAFAFWPQQARPVWARNVPDDLDDTAIIAGELLRHGRLETAAAWQIFRDVMLPNRVQSAILPQLPPWIVAGSFFTWVVPSSFTQRMPVPNIVDCCVNANIAAFLAMIGGDVSPGFAEALATVNAGLAWAGGDVHRLSALTPFYPSPLNFLEAVEHAVDSGVTGLQPARQQLRHLLKRQDLMKPGICRAAYSSSVVWHSPALEAARQLSQGMGLTEEPCYGTH
jgi:hypothetical protein